MRTDPAYLEARRELSEIGTQADLMDYEARSIELRAKREAPRRRLVLTCWTGIGALPIVLWLGLYAIPWQLAFALILGPIYLYAGWQMVCVVYHNLRRQRLGLDADGNPLP